MVNNHHSLSLCLSLSLSAAFMSMKITTYVTLVHATLSPDDPEFALYAHAHPFKVVAVDSPAVSNYSKVGFEVQVRGKPTVVAPEYVGAQVRCFSPTYRNLHP